MKIHTVQSGQSLFDIATIVYGDVTGIAQLLADNKELNGPTDRTYPGQQLKYLEIAIDLRRKVYLDDYKTIATIKREDMPEGIGFYRLDEYLIGGVPLALAFVPGTLDFDVNPEGAGGGFTIAFAINLEGVYTVTFTDQATSGVQTFADNFFQAGVPFSFGIFTAGTFDIHIASISSQITIP
jgi:hypothetical protein